jgi:hypothetical protein
LGKRISGLYRKRKEKLQTAIKQKEFQNKMKLLGKSGCKSRNKSKAFWNLLKGPKVEKKCLKSDSRVESTQIELKCLPNALFISSRSSNICDFVIGSII